MENSGKISSDAKMADTPEESSWTFYIEGFRCDNNNNYNYFDENENDRNSCHSSEYESPSLVSDAGSGAVKKFTNNILNCTDNQNIGFSNSYGKSISRTICKQNSFKKQKTKAMLPAMDFDLEDTASSPVNSPKVSYLNDQFMNHKEKGKMDFSELVKRNIFTKSGVFAAERDTETVCTDLKKKTCG